MKWFSVIIVIGLISHQHGLVFHTKWAGTDTGCKSEVGEIKAGEFIQDKNTCGVIVCHNTKGDPTHYVTITTQRAAGNGTASSNGENGGDTTDANNTESARIKQLVGQLQNNLCNVSVMNDADLDSLSNMDPNSLVDITGKEFMEQLKDAGRPLCAKRNAEDRLNLLKLLKAGAIFCSERYPEDAEAIDREIGRQLNEVEHGQNLTAASNARTIEVVQCDNQNTTITITVGEVGSTGNTNGMNNPTVEITAAATDAAAAEANAANANGDI